VRPEATDVLEAFDRDGYVVFRDVLDADLVAEASAHVEWLQRRHPDLRPEHLGHFLVRDDPFWVRLVSDDRLVDLAELFVGPDVALFASHYISKPPFDGREVRWHQDAAYWPLEPMEVVTVWLAIDESTPENGCMRVIPGTHKGPDVRLRPIADPDDAVLPYEADTEVDESRAVDLVLQAGDCEVHHPGIMHGSTANLSPKRRCGLTIRYIPTSTRILLEQPSESAFHLRGAPGVNPFRGCDAWA
jgi:phytanoyl-CoA hydroxylase